MKPTRGEVYTLLIAACLGVWIGAAWPLLVAALRP